VIELLGKDRVSDGSSRYRARLDHEVEPCLDFVIEPGTVLDRESRSGQPCAAMSNEAARSKTIELTAIVATVALLVGAIGVRGLRGALAARAQDRPREKTEIAEPMQLLGRGASMRIEELTARVSEAVKPNWSAAHRLPFALRDCPKLLDWIESADGQRFERLLAELRRGSREDAFASLALTLALARATEWNPGLLARTQNAERLGALLQEWLRAWGERGVGDTLLAERRSPRPCSTAA